MSYTCTQYVVTVIHELAGWLDGRAEVLPARESFDRIGPG